MRSFSKSECLLSDSWLSGTATDCLVDLVRIEEPGRVVAREFGVLEFTIVQALSSSFRKTGCNIFKTTSWILGDGLSQVSEIPVCFGARILTVVPPITADSEN